MKDLTKAASILVLVLAAAASRSALGQTYVPTQAKPPQLAAAKTVYVANDFGFEYSDSDRAYDEAIAGVQHLNRFTLVADPAAADLILDFKFATTFPAGGIAGGSIPYVILTILEGKTHIVLWSVSGQGVPKALPHAHIGQNEADVIDRLMDYLKIVTAPR
jgi:hypothetical protein